VSRVLALVPDLLFGSKVQAMLATAGHDVELARSETEVSERIAGADVLVVDLTTDDVDPAAVLDTLRADGEAAGVKALAFYSHVDVDVRRRAEEAGFELVVPRSRMAREGADLVARLSS
jgi:CheY-like chemotaxis protein